MTMMKSSVVILFLVATVALFAEEACSFAPAHHRLVHPQAGHPRAVSLAPWSSAAAATAPKLFMTSEGDEETDDSTTAVEEEEEATEEEAPEEEKAPEAAAATPEPAKEEPKATKKKTDLIGDVGDSVVEPDLAEAAEKVFEIVVSILTAIFQAIGPLLEGLGESNLLEGLGGSLSETASSLFASATSKPETVDVSIPYNAAAKLAYDEWLEKYPKDEDNDDEEDEGSFEIFVENYKLVTVRNIKAKLLEKEQNAKMAAWAEEMETWAETMQGKGEDGADVSPAPQAPPAVDVKFYDLNAQADTLSTEDYARILDQGLVESLVGGAFDFASNLLDKTVGKEWVENLNNFGKTGTFGVKKPKPAAADKKKKAPAKAAARKMAVAPKKPAPKKKKPVAATKKPTGPILSKWKQNPDGSLTGRISGSPNFRNGQKITTSPIRNRNLSKGMTVVTGSGSRYYLN